MKIDELNKDTKDYDLVKVFQKIYSESEDFSNDEFNLIIGIAHSILNCGINKYYSLKGIEFDSYREKIMERTETKKNDFKEYLEERKYTFSVYHMLCFHKPSKLKIETDTNAANYIANFYSILFKTKRGSSNRIFTKEGEEKTIENFKKEVFLSEYGNYNYEEAIRKICGNFINGNDNKYSNAEKIRDLYISEIQKNLILVNGKNTKVGDEMEIIKEKKMVNKIKKLIKNNVKQIILTGAPGTGKTYMAKEIAREEVMKELDLCTEEEKKSYSELEKEKKDEIDNYIEFVQFHPSYDYTDFVEGLRPVEIGDQVTFKKLDGIFKAFCRKVVEEKNNKKHFFIIDEINRADLSKVLGELMFGIEKDKRGENNKFVSQYQNLKTYSIEDKRELTKDEFADGFYIPENVIIIGTMNDIDRSVESMDFALRRRFTWVDVDVTNELLKDAFESKNEKEEYKFFDFIKDEELHRKVSKDIIDCIKKLNDIISDEGKKYSLNKHYYISQGYFANLPENLKQEDNPQEAIINHVWDYRLKSLIYEYVRGEAGGEKFVEKCENAFKGKNDLKNEGETEKNNEKSDDK